MSTPKERLHNAAKRLVRSAEQVEDIAEEAHNGTVSGNQGEIGREMLKESLGKVKKFTQEIEGIIK